MNITLFFILAFMFIAILSIIIWIIIDSKKNRVYPEFGDYMIFESIGRGGMAVILRAKNKILNTIVAVKVLDVALMNDKDLVYKFLKEGENLERINSQFPDSPVVKAIEYSHPQSNGPYFIAMDYLKGVDLLKIMKTNKIPLLKTKLYIVKEVARALQASHSLKIYHRDIAPDNVIINGDQVTLIDFGIAKQEFSDYRTQDNAIAGKPYYMSPEQGAGQTIDEKTDIYSLGAVLYYLVEGKPPYDAQNPIEILKMHQKNPIPEITAPIPNDLKSFIKKMLAKKPGERPDAMEVVNKMESFLKQGVN